MTNLVIKYQIHSIAEASGKALRIINHKDDLVRLITTAAYWITCLTMCLMPPELTIEYDNDK